MQVLAFERLFQRAIKLQLTGHRTHLGARQGLERLELQLKMLLEHREGVRQGDRVLCTWKTQESERIDTKALRKEQPQIAVRYLKTSTTRVLRVKEQSDE